MMPQTLEELAMMISERDKISFTDAADIVRDCAQNIEYAFYNGSLDLAEEILATDLGLEPDYLELFIF